MLVDVIESVVGKAADDRMPDCSTARADTTNPRHLGPPDT